jgi:hypothetical protein
MPLVLKAEGSMVAHRNDDRGLGEVTLKSYVPLIVVVGLVAMASLIVSARGGLSIQDFVLRFMTGFFLVFGAFKLMDLRGFAEGYATYDLVAGRWLGYGYAYPFVELAFGFLMLYGVHSPELLWTEFAVMTVSGLGVVRKIARRESVQCVCLGTFLKVPLTYVTLIEDFGMAALALLSLSLR